MNDYLNGSILEMLERVKVLKSKIPIPIIPTSFHQLATKAMSALESIFNGLVLLRDDTRYQIKSNLPFKMIEFQKIVNHLDYLENYIISALNRYSEDDGIITNLVQKICKEINYPLLPPVGSSLSQSYYCIDPILNHLRVPLLESEFLLHLPDIYHELAHPLITTKNHPNVIQFQEKLGQFNLIIRHHYEDEIINLKRNNGEDQIKYIEIILDSWIQGWSIELFCDLFGTYTLGTAYAWAHLHLSVKRGSNPYEKPEDSMSSHPSDDARMKTILYGLSLIGLDKENKIIDNYWGKYLLLNGASVDWCYKVAYPKTILEHCAVNALEATKVINCKIVNQGNNKDVCNLLNTAWMKFIDNPQNYLVWEKEQREKLKFN
ncbi:MAG: hypothetical protein EPN82_12830 [Bacteroidetes bacterium]|nr:MAG: hypothetical protein EPN82_12830 [Bacteroidota bacterium]